MATVASPKAQVVDGGGRGNQRVSQFNMVAFGELAEKVSGALADLGVDGNTVNGCEKSFEDPILRWSGAMPKLSDRDRRTEQSYTAAAQRFPPRENIFISCTRDFDQDIGVDQKGFQDEILVSRFPLRRRRT